MVTKIVFEQSVLVLPQSIMWSGTYWSPWIAHTWINKLLPLHSSLGVLHAHHRVNTPMDRLHINTGARCTSVVPLEKQHWSHMLFACSRKYRISVFFSFSTASFTSFSLSTGVLWNWQNCTARHCQAEFSSILHQCNKFGVTCYCLQLNFVPYLWIWLWDFCYSLNSWKLAIGLQTQVWKLCDCINLPS